MAVRLDRLIVSTSSKVPLEAVLQLDTMARPSGRVAPAGYRSADSTARTVFEPPGLCLLSEISPIEAPAEPARVKWWWNRGDGWEETPRRESLQAGPRQIDNPKLGMTHNLGGWPGRCVSFCSIVGT